MAFHKCTIKDYTPLNDFADEFGVHHATWSASQLDEPSVQFVCMFLPNDGCVLTTVLKNGKIVKVGLPKSKKDPEVFVPRKLSTLVACMSEAKDNLQAAVDQAGIEWIM